MNKMKKLALAAGVFFAAVTPVQAEPLTASVSRVSADVANTIAMSAMKACREKGIPVSVTVVDRNGIIQSQVRDTTAPAVSLPISKNKAYTAVMFNAKGSQLEGRANTPLQHMDVGLAFMAGSTTIAAAGKIFGAVGVSGAPDGMVDEECAIKGVEAVIDDLEMM
jgi:uncharacterized protein GlcG (DUF336 family)